MEKSSLERSPAYLISLKKDVYNLNCLLRKGIINTYFFLFCLIIGLLEVLCGALACSSFSEAVNVTYELLAIGSK